jgi:hypothetical protein
MFSICQISPPSVADRFPDPFPCGRRHERQGVGRDGELALL